MYCFTIRALTGMKSEWAGHTSSVVKKISLLIRAPVVQTLDSAIHRINHYPTDKY